MASPLEIKVPDIGDFDEVEIIEILVSEGQQVAAEDPLITLESDKATMDIPAPQDGTIAKLLVQVGQMVSEGTPIALLAAGAEGDDQPAAQQPVKAKTPETTEPPKPTESAQPSAPATPATPPRPAEKPDTAPPQQSSAAGDAHQPPPTLPPPVARTDTAPPHASPGIRRFARELGAPLAQIPGSGPRGRILKEDIKAWVKARLSAPAATHQRAAAGIPAIPDIDFSQFGKVETVPLSRIKKLSGPHLQRAWLNVPHVTHHDEADITELENFRQSLKAEAEKEGIRITLLGFVIKILAGGLKKFPAFNASLNADGAGLVMKKYYNIGIAVDTPNGLVVPVIRAVERKTIFDLAREMGEISRRARDGKLKPDDLQGGCISISSLGGIGGSAFTPIVNAPEVAILGITRARMTPVWDGEQFQPRLMLPLDLSYDHRVIDGAEAARFVAFLVQSFGDLRRLAL